MGIAFDEGITQEQHDKAAYDGLSDWLLKEEQRRNSQAMVGCPFCAKWNAERRRDREAPILFPEGGASNRVAEGASSIVPLARRN